MTQLLSKRIAAIFLVLSLWASVSHAGDDTGLHFDGINDSVSFTQLALTGNTGTIEFWLNYQGPTPYYGLFVYNGSWGYNGFGLGSLFGELAIFAGANGT